MPIRRHDYFPYFLPDACELLCDGSMKTTYRSDTQQTIEASLLEGGSEPRTEGETVEAAERAAAVRRDQADRELRAAREEAIRLRTQARNRSAEMKTEALRERIELRSAAEKQIARIREQAERDAERIRVSATDDVDRIRAEAEGEAAAIVESANEAATKAMARSETGIAGMIEDAHRLAAQIVDAAQLEADVIVAEAAKRIGALDETVGDLAASIAEIKERFNGAESPEPEVEPVGQTAGADPVFGMDTRVISSEVNSNGARGMTAASDDNSDGNDSAGPPRRRWALFFRRA